MTGVNLMKYRKKPVVIEAFQMTEAARHDRKSWPDWLVEARGKRVDEAGAVYPDMAPGRNDRLLIATLEGSLEIAWDDWIIRGVQGELYPCKPDIFAATYEPVEDAA